MPRTTPDDAHELPDPLATALLRCTPLQRRFLVERWKGDHRTDKECARAVGIHPGSVYNWRLLSKPFRGAEAASAQVYAALTQAEWLRDYRAQLAAAEARRNARIEALRSTQKPRFSRGS